MTVQCEGCGRLRNTSGVWVIDSTTKVDVLGYCGLCGELEKRAQERKWQREGRKLLRDRVRGYGPGTGDPFAGMRGNQ